MIIDVENVDLDPVAYSHRDDGMSVFDQCARSQAIWLRMTEVQKEKSGMYIMVLLRRGNFFNNSAPTRFSWQIGYTSSSASRQASKSRLSGAPFMGQ